MSQFHEVDAVIEKHLYEQIKCEGVVKDKGINVDIDLAIPIKRGEQFRVEVRFNVSGLKEVQELSYFEIVSNYSLTFDGDITRTITLKNCWFKTVASEHNASRSSLPRAIIHCDEIEIIDHLAQKENEVDFGERLLFYHTPSYMLRSIEYQEMIHDGNVKLNKINKFEVSTLEGYSYESCLEYKCYNLNDETRMFKDQYLLAVNNCSEGSIPDQIKIVEDLLLMASFGELNRISLLGYTYTSKIKHVRVYFTNAYTTKKVAKHYDVVVEFDFKEFLENALRVYNGSRYKDALYQAINRILSKPKILEYAFITGFSCLETIYDTFKIENKLENILIDGWDDFGKEVKKSIKKLAVGMSPEVRAGIYNKIPELNRYPFSHIQKEFETTFGIYIEDLWPLSNPMANSLIDIRNKLVHGKIINHDAYEILWKAESNLEWVLFRYIFSLLNIEMEKTRIKEKHLKCYKAYKFYNNTSDLDKLFNQKIS